MAVISLVSVSSFSLRSSLSLGLSGEESDAVVTVKNSRVVMRTGSGDVEHALELTQNHIVESRDCPNIFWQRVTTIFVGWFAGLTCASYNKTGNEHTT